MSSTYTQLHIQLIFAVKYRQALIHKSWKNELHAYITGIVQNNGHKMVSINSMPDHIHILIGYRPSQLLGNLIENIKTSSNKWIKTNGLSRYPFAWQAGYSAFSYSKSQIPMIARYIENQENHHQKQSFREEYLALLKSMDIPYDERYVFEFFDDVAGDE
ncbi:MAG: IS200/IS605 family transposase [Bacteroidia bacterium]|nr:IS200/IS605 family transposase [Bacteroidia bacterium]